MTEFAPTRIILDEMRPADAYVLGCEETLASFELGADQEASLQASRLSRRLDEILERVYRIAPFEVAPPEGLSESAVYAQPEGVFDWQAEAA
ncbi:MAG: hypothetical protein NUW01_02865 [Gemmatimonadaceae bacterium]|nr:hypothetical protein [Gemmatimonadaceae bacterium]